MSETKSERPAAAGVLWLRIATVYLVIGVGLGIFMGAKGDFSLVSAHSHLNLLGWEALALVGVIYRQMPRLEETRLARTQFWLHNIGLPGLVIGLIAREEGSARVEPLIAGASVAIGVAVFLFAANILLGTRKDAAA